MSNLSKISYHFYQRFRLEVYLKRKILSFFNSPLTMFGINYGLCRILLEGNS